MTRTRVRAWVTVSTILVGGLLVPAAPAEASCAEDAGPEGAPVIFVGTAESERRGYTRFDVREVWAGPDLAPDVWVLSGQEQGTWPMSMLAGVGSSTDADFIQGETYVVGASESFATDACTSADADGTAAHPGAREAVDDGVTGADPPIGPVGQTLWVVTVVATLAAAVTLLRRRQAARTTSRR